MFIINTRKKRFFAQNYIYVSLLKMYTSGNVTISKSRYTRIKKIALLYLYRYSLCQMHSLYVYTGLRQTLKRFYCLKKKKNVFLRKENTRGRKPIAPHSDQNLKLIRDCNVQYKIVYKSYFSNKYM